MTFVVIIARNKYDFKVVGPYRSFKRAEGDAVAWQKAGVETWVEPLTKPEAA